MSKIYTEGIRDIVHEFVNCILGFLVQKGLNCAYENLERRIDCS